MLILREFLRNWKLETMTLETKTNVQHKSLHIQTCNINVFKHICIPIGCFLYTAPLCSFIFCIGLYLSIWSSQQQKMLLPGPKIRVNDNIKIDFKSMNMRAEV